MKKRSVKRKKPQNSKCSSAVKLSAAGSMKKKKNKFADVSEISL